MENEKVIKGYKVFNTDWTCRGFQYEVGKTYEEDVKLSCCDRGFHFCKKISDCFNYYKFDSDNRVAEVEALGEVDQKGDKSCTNKIRIVKEILWEDVLSHCNTGHSNTGDRNTGYYNTGDYNTGNYNTGHYNTGYCNTGDYNTGYCNTGNSNTGDRNTGDYNTGDYNTGYYNTGDYNTGYYNTGHYNTGYCNTGNSNTGNYNTGDSNTGNYNTGDSNTGNYNTGIFNTLTPRMRIFDVESEVSWSEWEKTDAKKILDKKSRRATEWINSSDMTAKEKIENPTHEITGGYLKTCDLKESWIKWWKELTKKEKEIIKNIPNFNAKKFFIITGIEVEEVEE